MHGYDAVLYHARYLFVNRMKAGMRDRDKLFVPVPPTCTSIQLQESCMPENYWGKNAIELHYADCEHTRFIPHGHTADHQHCYGCNPELAKEPLPGCCEDCQRGLRALRAGQGGE